MNFVTLLLPDITDDAAPARCIDRLRARVARPAFYFDLPIS